MKVQLLHPRATLEMFGQIPRWLNETNPAPAAKQLDQNYPFGGWQPFAGAKLNKDLSFSYPGDPPQPALGIIYFREERVVFYPYSWVGIIQSDGAFELARLD